MFGFMHIFWIIVMIAALITEAASFNLVSIWFALGALGAEIAAVMGASGTIQFIVFFAVSIITLAATRPVVRKLMPKKYIPTNGELDIGKSAVVIEKIDLAAGTGRVRVEGVDWGAKSEDGSVIEEGAYVTVTGKGAASLTVRKS